MAKKQGINYNPNTALIQGAATAYRNWDNVTGVYAGLDKLAKTGEGIMQLAIASRLEIERRWNDSANQVLLNSGSLGEVLFDSTSKDVDNWKNLYLEGVNEKDDRKKMRALSALQNHSNWIQDHKQINIDYAKAKTEGNLSDYYTNSPRGREEANFIDQIMGQKYKKTSKNAEGDTLFHVYDLSGQEVMISSKEYNDMIVPKNFKVTAAYTDARVESYKLENFEEEFFRQKVKNSLPNNKRDFEAVIFDDISGQNFVEMLRTSETLDQEIISAINPAAWDFNDNQILDSEEKDAFIDAATNTSNPLFNLDVSKKILEDQLVRHGRESHKKYWESKNKDDRTGLRLSYGHRYWGQMQRDYDNIKAGKEMIKGGDGTIWNKQPNGTYKHSDGNVIYTPNQLKDHLELHHLPDLPEPEGGYPDIDLNSENIIPPIPHVEDFRMLGGLNSDKRDVIINNWKQEYPNFKFEKGRYGNVTITAPNNKQLVVKLGSALGNKETQAKEFNEFIANNQ